MIYIIAKRHGFYRCGVAHSDTLTEWPDNHFTAEQIAQLEAEPMLIVTRKAPQVATQQTADEQITKLKHAVIDANACCDDLRAQLAEQQADADAREALITKLKKDVIDANARADELETALAQAVQKDVPTDEVKTKK